MGESVKYIIRFYQTTIVNIYFLSYSLYFYLSISGIHERSIGWIVHFRESFIEEECQIRFQIGRIVHWRGTRWNSAWGTTIHSQDLIRLISSHIGLSFWTKINVDWKYLINSFCFTIDWAPISLVIEISYGHIHKWSVH